MAKAEDAPLSIQQWRLIIADYETLRDLERPAFMDEARGLIADLERDATTLYDAALKMMRFGVVTPIERMETYTKPGSGINLADFGASGVLRRLAKRGYEQRHFRLTEGTLGNLERTITREAESFRLQAWRLDIAAEHVKNWIDVYLDRRKYLREHDRGRTPSVGLDMLLGQTLRYPPSEIADQLVAAKVFPERESDHDDPRAQWMQHLKRARTRYRKRYAEQQSSHPRGQKGRASRNSGDPRSSR